MCLEQSCLTYTGQALSSDLVQRSQGTAYQHTGTHGIRSCSLLLCTSKEPGCALRFPQHSCLGCMIPTFMRVVFAPSLHSSLWSICLDSYSRIPPHMWASTCMNSLQWDCHPSSQEFQEENRLKLPPSLSKKKMK